MGRDDDRLPTQPRQPDERQRVNAGSRRGQRKAAKETLRQKGRVDSFWRGVLADEVGRSEVWGLLKDAGTFDNQFACGPNGFPQPEATWFHAGAHSFGQRLFLTLMLRDQKGTMLMLQEHDPRFKQMEAK